MIAVFAALFGAFLIFLFYVMFVRPPARIVGRPAVREEASRVYRRNIDSARIQGVDDYERFACRRSALRRLTQLGGRQRAIVLRRSNDEWLMLMGARLAVIPLDPTIVGAVPVEFTHRSQPRFLDNGVGVEGMQPTPAATATSDVESEEVNEGDRLLLVA